jgi:N-acetyltransferase
VIGYNLPLTVSHQSPTQLRPVTLSGLLVRLEPLEAGLGSTRFMDIAVAHRRLEIGATWLTPAAQRTGANIEAKLLLLTEAFERLRIQKVVFKTETLNEQSQRAIRALGAVEEGIFRQQFISESGRARDMIYFAIFAESWTETKTRLQERLERYRSSG